MLLYLGLSQKCDASDLLQGQHWSREGDKGGCWLLGITKLCSDRKTLTRLHFFEHAQHRPSSSSFPLLASPCASQLDVFIFKTRLLAVAAASAVTVTPAPSSASQPFAFCPLGGLLQSCTAPAYICHHLLTVGHIKVAQLLSTAFCFALKPEQLQQGKQFSNVPLPWFLSSVLTFLGFF